jgi:hypothetical protein
LLCSFDFKARDIGTADMSVAIPSMAVNDKPTTKGIRLLSVSDHAPSFGCMNSPMVGLARNIIDTTHFRTPCLVRKGIKTASLLAQQNSTTDPIEHIAINGNIR